MDESHDDIEQTLDSIRAQLDEYVRAGQPGEARQEARDRELVIWEAIFATQEAGTSLPTSQDLSLGYLDLTALSPTLFQLPPATLGRLDISFNRLSTFPPEIGRFDQLTLLSAQDNLYRARS